MKNLDTFSFLPEGAIEKFGTELGRAPGDVPVYSSDYKTVDSHELPTRFHFKNFVDGLYTGYKWQCVEFARRWLLTNKGYVFADIAMAYDIFRLTSAKRIADNKSVPLHSFENGSQRRPEPGCMLIWNEGGEFEVTGHVAIVTEVFDDRVRIVEQNVENRRWEQGRDYSRELKVCIDEDGSYWIDDCTFPDTSIRGWVIQTEDASHAVIPEPMDENLFTVKLHATGYKPAKNSWLNIAKPDEAAYVARNGHSLCSLPGREDQYLTISKTAVKELKRATNELHALFMHGTEYVMEHEELWHHFNIPEELWPRIRKCWNDRRNHMVTGRFDFCMTRDGLKVYEYNCDSASCHMEAGKVQGLWAQHYHCDEGEDAGADLFEQLVDAWRFVPVDGLVHLLLDNDGEEVYHTCYMREAMTQAGLQTRVMKEFSQARWNGPGEVVDGENNPVHKIWKTWAWETALEQLREQIRREGNQYVAPCQGTPRLMDILLQPQTAVFEPLWTLVPSNKAILPILWDLFPESPYLLESHFEQTPFLEKDGFVAKPIAGRCGHNISIVNHDAEVVTETAGKFDKQDFIYQALAPLPVVDSLRVQLCTFTAWGSYAGACARVDPSLIITTDSELMPLRVCADKQFLESEVTKC